MQKLSLWHVQMKDKSGPQNGSAGDNILKKALSRHSVFGRLLLGQQKPKLSILRYLQRRVSVFQEYFYRPRLPLLFVQSGSYGAQAVLKLAR